MWKSVASVSDHSMEITVYFRRYTWKLLFTLPLVTTLSGETIQVSAPG